jgi:ribonuclease P protein component
MCCRRKPILTLRTGNAFRAVYQGGRHYVAGSFFVVYVKPSEETRLGLSVSKKVGNAVVRNRVKRWVKESCRLRPLAGGYDCVVVARPAVGLLPRKGAYTKVDKVLGDAFNRLGI